jgi:hypothetical protein
MGNSLLIYFGHKSSKASGRQKSFINYIISYPTTNPTHPPWLITKPYWFIHSTSCNPPPAPAAAASEPAVAASEPATDISKPATETNLDGDGGNPFGNLDTHCEVNAHPGLLSHR